MTATLNLFVDDLQRAGVPFSATVSVQGAPDGAKVELSLSFGGNPEDMAQTLTAAAGAAAANFDAITLQQGTPTLTGSATDDQATVYPVSARTVTVQ